MVGSVVVVDSQQQYQPEEVHRILSQSAYGEEDEAFLEGIEMKVAIQVPWTTQLRLCLRRSSLQQERQQRQQQQPNMRHREKQSPQQLENLLLPHVWNKVHKLQVDDDEDHFGLEDETWKQDVMMKSWNLTRFHVQRDLRVISRMLRTIMEKIDSLLGMHQHVVQAMPFDGYGPHFVGNMMKTPQQVLRGIYEDGDSDEDDRYQQQSRRIMTPISMHPHFVNWISKTTHLRQNEQHQPKMYRELCRQIGLNRTKLKRITEQLHNLPVGVLAKGLTDLQLCANSQICDMDAQRGRALVTALLKRIGVDIHLHPLPQELLMHGCSNKQQLERSIELYLWQGLPNVNSLVVFLWTQQQQQHIEQQLVVPFASWLPVEPIVPLLQRSIVTSQPHDLIERAIDFFLALPWEPHHLETAFAPFFVDHHQRQHLPIPTDAASLKEACRKRSWTQQVERHSTILDQHPKRSRNAPRIPPPSIHELVKQVWGTTPATASKGLVLDHVEYSNYSVGPRALDEVPVTHHDRDGFNRMFHENQDDENEDDDDLFDETDDRVLLL